MLSSKNSTSSLQGLGQLSTRTKTELMSKTTALQAALDNDVAVEEPKICFGEEFFIPPR